MGKILRNIETKIQYIYKNHLPMEQHFIPVTKKARYTTLGNSSANKILIVLHGYGQLTEFFIKKFENLVDKNYLIVAPEGLHRFYLKGSSGRVGASWMSKELREQDIEENNDYLCQLMKTLTQDHPSKEISILGFSQGGATAARWIKCKQMEPYINTGYIKHFVLWASVFPPDLNIDDFSLPTIDKTFVIGKEDEFYNAENQSQIIDFYKKLNFSIIHFDGKHDIEQKSLILLTDN